MSLSDRFLTASSITLGQQSLCPYLIIRVCMCGILVSGKWRTQPVGENVLAAACSQMADQNLSSVTAGSIMAMVFVVAVIVHLRRAFTTCCCSMDRARSMYRCTTWTVFLLLAIGLTGGLITVSTVASLCEYGRLHPVEPVPLRLAA